MKHGLCKIMLVALVLLCGGARAMADDVVWTNVATAAEFDAAIQKESANIRLTADIDLSSLKQKGVNVYLSAVGTFKGKITGEPTDPELRNYMLKGAQHTMFYKLSGAEISHLIVGNCTFDAGDTGSGLFADESENTTFTDIMMDNVSVVGSSSLVDCDRMGALTGVATGCTFQNLIFIGCQLTIDGYKLGLACGEATNCTFTNCIANLYCDVWADGNTGNNGSAAYAGAICGWASGCTLTKCYNMGCVSSDDDCTGGILGYGTATTLEDCQNVGLVSHSTRAGIGRLERESVANKLLIAATAVGVVGAAAEEILSSQSVLDFINEYFDQTQLQAMFVDANCFKVENEYNALYVYGGNDFATAEGIAQTVFTAAPQILMGAAGVMAGVAFSIKIYNVTTAPDQIGGIAGCMEGNSHVLRCTNGGPVNGADEEVGGIVGRLVDSSVESCYNRSFVNGGYSMLTGEYVGGIVGKCTNGTVKGNLNVGPVDAAATHIGEIEGGIIDNYTGSNNYFMANQAATYGETAISFTQDQLASGAIAKALNDALGENPIWRQELGTDFYPVIDNENKPLVTATTDTYSLVQKVYNASDFYLAVANPNAQISIQNDIDLGNFYFNCSSEAIPFRGTIEGNGHALKNASYQVSGENSVNNKYKALFPYAVDATFQNLILDGFHITQANTDMGEVDYLALLVAKSNGCTYTNVTLKNSNILLNEDPEQGGSPDYQRHIGGLVSDSNYDIFTGCTVDGSCDLQGYIGVKSSTTDAYVAGIASVATNGTFIECHNAAGIWAEDDEVGGIVGYAENCTLKRCLNSGPITGQERVGGIGGHVNKTVVLECVNVGTIYDDENKAEKNHGGIVGYIEGTGSAISSCLNFGEIKYPGTDCGAIEGSRETSTVNPGIGNYYYCQYGDGRLDNVTSSGVLAQLQSGAYALSNDLYQYIDGEPFCTTWPVPIPRAGTVYSNVLCDDSHTQKYSNHYHADQDHSTSEYAGICYECGRTLFSCSTLDVSTPADLCNLAYAVNAGAALTDVTVELKNDIDMTGVTDFLPIGISRETPFRGTFHGNGHRIKNLTLNRINDEEGTGLFGNVSGTTTITDLVMDKSCSIRAYTRGVAGIVGIVSVPKNSTETPSLTLERCGNEAQVTSGICNAAGLVGGVYYNTNASLNLLDCYNSGSIAGPKESAALVAYGPNNMNIRRCFNVGHVSGYDTHRSMLRFVAGADTTHILYNYQASTIASDYNAAKATPEDMLYGGLCNTMIVNGQYDYDTPVWGENLGTDSYPYLTSAGIHHERNMSSIWGTVVVPYVMNSSEEIQLYTINDIQVENGQGCLKLTATDQVAANTPCFFKKLDDSATSVCFSKGKQDFWLPSDITRINNPEEDRYQLIGSYVTMKNLTDVMFIASNKMWFAEDAITVPAYRAYLPYNITDLDPLLSGVKSMNIVVEENGETTKIGEITAQGEVKLYNLQGLRVSANTRGVVIKNGKKHLNR